MPELIEYMQFSLGVYDASERNRLGDPLGWTKTKWQPDLSSGFSAGCYVANSGDDIVIYFTGTNDSADKVNWLIERH